MINLIKTVNASGGGPKCVARPGFVQNRTVMQVCLCFPFYPSLKIAKVPGVPLRALGSTTGWGTTPPAEGCGHRHWVKISAAIWVPVGTKKCRSAQNACKTCNSQQQRAKLAWQCNSRHVCTKHTPYHVIDSKGHVPRFSDHQSRISMHDGPKNQECNFDFKCMQTT